MDHQDSFWVERTRRGDKRAFGLLIDKYRSRIERLIAEALGPEDAPDLVQETFLQAYLGLDRLRDPARFGAWLYGIALNLIRMRHRQRRQRDVTSWEVLQGGTARPADGLPTADSAEERALTRMLHDALQDAIQDLSAVNRQAVVLHYVDGLSYREMAELLDVPVSTVKSRLHKARQQLRAELAPLFEPLRKELPAMIEATVYEIYTVENLNDEHPGHIAGQPHAVVVLKARDRQQYLPIWIGPSEALGILLHLRGRQPLRPLTFDLMARLLEATGAQVESVTVNALREETFYAAVRLASNGETQEVDARPSDALNLALRTGAAIFIDPDVLATVGTDDPQRSVSERYPETVIKPMELPDWPHIAWPYGPDPAGGKQD